MPLVHRPRPLIKRAPEGHCRHEPSRIAAPGAPLAPHPSPLTPKKQNAPGFPRGRFRINLGGDLLSHAVAHAVSSALRGLTTVFGMGTGVTLSVWPPKTLESKFSATEYGLE
jgi:hypothetical protein